MTLVSFTDSAATVNVHRPATYRPRGWRSSFIWKHIIIIIIIITVPENAQAGISAKNSEHNVCKRKAEELKYKIWCCQNNDLLMHYPTLQSLVNRPTQIADHSSNNWASFPVSRNLRLSFLGLAHTLDKLSSIWARPILAFAPVLQPVQNMYMNTWITLNILFAAVDPARVSVVSWS